MGSRRYKHTELTKQVISAFYRVYNALGYGFLEKVYENAMAIELRDLGIKVVQQAPVNVYYSGRVVGEYYIDLLVEDRVIVELKAVRKLTDEHKAQLLNYLKATRFEVGLLLNFGTEAEIVRRAFDNQRKGKMTWTNQPYS